MSDKATQYIESGILEMYVLGMTSPEESVEVESMSAAYPEVRKEIEDISRALEMYSAASGVSPKSTVKTFIMATIDYSERMKNGEAASYPPALSETSRVEDYAEWLSRPDMVPPTPLEGVFAKIIGYTAKVTTAIVWVKDILPAEIHDNEFEKFLIVEGTCDLSIDDKVHKLAAGDYLSIPLYSVHRAKVTSQVPCKIVLQRVAA